MELKDISYKIRGAIFEVYNNLGPGLLENIYTSALKYELSKLFENVEIEKTLNIYYKDIKMDLGYRLDIIIDNKVIIEVKSVEKLHEIHHKQLLTYLRLSNLRLGILVNFNSNDITKNIIRKII
jgi:GxxExxY protein